MPNRNEIDTRAWGDAAEYRASLYRTMSALFADAPSKEALRALVQAACEDAEEEGRRPSELQFCAYLRSLDGRVDDGLRMSIASEYAELFVGPRPPLAPLYESVYLGSPSRLFTEQTMSVRRFYERCGLTVVKDGKVPDDHIAYELELMAELARREVEALAEGRIEGATELQRLQREFIVVHLGSWTSPFAHRVDEAPCSDFYAALARFADAFVAEDDAYLGMAVRAREGDDAATDNDGRTETVPE